MVGIPSLRSLINLLENSSSCDELHEGKKKQKSSSSPQEEANEWKIVTSDIFPQMLVSTRKTFSDIDDKLAKFVQIKLANPLDPNNRFGKHDRPMTGHLSGFLHCHLRDDAILIYTLANRNVNLIALVTHAEIEGKRLHKMAKKLGSYLG